MSSRNHDSGYWSKNGVYHDDMVRQSGQVQNRDVILSDPDQHLFWLDRFVHRRPRTAIVLAAALTVAYVVTGVEKPHWLDSIANRGVPAATPTFKKPDFDAQLKLEAVVDGRPFKGMWAVVWPGGKITEFGKGSELVVGTLPMQSDTYTVQAFETAPDSSSPLGYDQISPTLNATFNVAAGKLALSKIDLAQPPVDISKPLALGWSQPDAAQVHTEYLPPVHLATASGW